MLNGRQRLHNQQAMATLLEAIIYICETCMETKQTSGTLDLQEMYFAYDTELHTTNCGKGLTLMHALYNVELILAMFKSTCGHNGRAGPLT